MTRVFGIDIRKGNIRSQTVSPHFSLVCVEDGKVVFEEKEVSIPKLFRMLQSQEALGGGHYNGIATIHDNKIHMIK